MGKPARKTAPAEAPLPQIGPSAVPETAEAITFPKALLPPALLNAILSVPGARWVYSVVERRHLVLLAGFCALIFFPFLGAVGFWDPWEPHYGEVARMMIVRDDFVHPYWECAYFFSKPILPLWLMAIGMLISGANDGIRDIGHMPDPSLGISVSTEWWVRSIIALLAVAGVLATYLAVSRTISRRAAVWSAIVLATTPFYFLLARQAMVDMPFVALNTCAIACLMIAVYEKEHVQDGWLYAFYALAGIGCLAKGLLGIALPGAAMLGYLILSGDWRLLTQLRLITGPIVTMLMFMPWYTVMTYFPGKDDESSTWFDRFIIHDHFQRGFEQVHTTTPNTNFTYFIEQLGYGLFPWIGAVPGALSTLFTRPPVTDPATRQRKAKLFVISWAVMTFTFFSLSGTKFHHYIFPAVPAISILVALWIEQVLEEGVSKHAIAWMVGAVLFGLVAQNIFTEPKHFTDLFVYNYDRPYPSHEVDPHAAFLWLFLLPPAFALFGIPAVRDWAVQFWNWKPTLPEKNRDRILGAVGVGLTAFITFALEIWFFLAKQHAWYGLRLPRDITDATPMGFFMQAALAAVVATAILFGIGWIPLSKFWHAKEDAQRQSEDTGDRLFVVGAVATMAITFAVYMSAVHWVKLTYHWTQRDLFWIYYHEAAPTEPIAAYQMNWRGETFYSRNTVRQLKEPGELRDFVAVPGREWILVEHARLQGMKSAIGPRYNVRVINKTFTDKFALVVVEDANSETPTQTMPMVSPSSAEPYDPNHIH